VLILLPLCKLCVPVTIVYIQKDLDACAYIVTLIFTH